MKQSALYFFIYLFVLCFLAKQIDLHMSISGFDGLLWIALWIVISSAIVHIIHFWPRNKIKE